jgi:hypothetical protein
VTDEGLMSLKGMSKLYSLDVRKSKVTGSGLSELQGLKSLRELWLDKEAAESEGAQALKKTLPKLSIWS